MNYDVFTSWDWPQGCGEGEDIFIRQYSSTGMPWAISAGE